MAICALCKQDRDLCESHISPAFAVRWLKETGATPYLRNAQAPNLRLQDARKPYLLCKPCELRFGKDEDTFSRTIFRPYVDRELNDRGEGTGSIKSFSYDSWLLRFIISLQWRVIAAEGVKGVPAQYIPGLAEFEETWRRFLLGERSDTGRCETHLIFLQALTAGRGGALLRMGSRVNYYILRSLDGTSVVSDKRKWLAVYSKLGPIAFYTSILPERLNDTPDSRVRMRGSLRVGQHLRNSGMNHFIFITRPNEVCPVLDQISEAQNERIARDMRRDLDKTARSLSFRAMAADKWIERIKKD